MISELVRQQLYKFKRNRSISKEKLISLVQVLPKSLGEYKFTLNYEKLCPVEISVDEEVDNGVEDLAPIDEMSEQIIEPLP